MRKIIPVVSWIAVLWMCYIFLGSLPYKFTQHPDTQHIFSTIGGWLGGFLGSSVGDLFTRFGAYVVGSFELLTSIILLFPAVIWIFRAISKRSMGHTRMRWHQVGGLMAAMVMSGAIFFHLFTPLGVEVLHNGKSDGGSLFYSAVSIFILGILLLIINRPPSTKR